MEKHYFMRAIVGVVPLKFCLKINANSCKPCLSFSPFLARTIL